MSRPVRAPTSARLAFRLLGAVDEASVASIAVLERRGFERAGEAPGAFGKMLLFRLPAGRRAGAE